ncbi:MAG: phosphotransferase [Bacteroidia bacterium]|nr:phosphotransferase [Bacteroidia bacterium]NNM15230.1 phosphotransferase [Bacteroidia bacterium]
MLQENLKAHVEIELSSINNKPTNILGTKPLSGGCINESVQLKTNNGFYFLKWNDAKAYPLMFETEAKGLKLLLSAGAIGVPKVVSRSEFENTSYLLLEFIEAGKEIKNYYETFGTNLARLHKCSDNDFGLEYNNYIGSLKQYNKQNSDGVTFFIEQRLQKQLSLAQENGLLPLELKRKFETFFERLPDLIPNEKPALLHGDLWSGNFITGKNGAAWLIDPAVYYGFREIDIAMSRLFGGFNHSFYSSYNNAFPMEPGWEQRLDYYNLYPLLVHVNLFGSSYLKQIESILSKF